MYEKLAILEFRIRRIRKALCDSPKNEGAAERLNRLLYEYENEYRTLLSSLQRHGV